MENDKQKKKKPSGLLIAAVGVCFGVLLLLFGGWEGETKGNGAESLPSAEEYRREIEDTLTVLCSRVEGAGNATVFVTLTGGYEYVYATDGEGECVTVGNGSSERAVVRSVRPPTIGGVGVVCPGAADPRVKAALCELICASLSVGSNRVCIVAGR